MEVEHRAKLKWDNFFEKDYVKETFLESHFKNKFILALLFLFFASCYELLYHVLLNRYIELLCMWFVTEAKKHVPSDLERLRGKTTTPLSF